MAESKLNVAPGLSQETESSEQHKLAAISDSNSVQGNADEVFSSKTVVNGVRAHGPTQIPGPTVSSTASLQRLASNGKTATTDGDGLGEPGKERPQRTEKSSPSWPTSPRLKSPPPSSLRSVSLRRNENSDHAQSNVSVKRLAPASVPELGAAMHLPPEVVKETNSPSKARSPARGPSTPSAGLETVAEGSMPPTPPNESVPKPSQTTGLESSALDDKGHGSINNGTGHTLEVPAKAGEESASVSAPASRAASTSRPSMASNLAKRSLTNLTAKKAAIEPMRSMTVETETVSSTPQLLVDRARDTGGSVRAKPSVETIRPRKDKKKASRKAPSLHAGSGTSKADIFEAKVASAVEEADSSDSDETFVYESNPPEPRQHRHHSRTPSATSTTSQMDHLGRGKHGVRSGSAAIQGKKSMKFSNNAYGTHLDPENNIPDATRNGTRNGSSAHRHHHIGRHGRNGHTSIIDADSPFSQAHRTTSPRTPTANGSRHSAPVSPRLSNGRLNNNRKSAPGGYDTYDDGADDERAPLMNSMRVNRNRHNRRPNGHFRSMEFAEQRETRCWPRYGGCLLLTTLIAVVAVGITTFVLALNRPLLDVEVKSIQHVLASEQELMLDLRVRAINPNLFTIAVNELDVNLFAESPYAGTSQHWREKGPSRRQSITERRKHRRALPERDLTSWFPPFGPADGVDEGTDPIDDPETGTQKLLLGQVLAFDSPLTFDPSPLRHTAASSDGAIRLKNPGNGTKDGGPERWERVMQHPFELIVRGVLKYQLPLSSHNRSAKISGRVKVLPGQDEDDGTNSTVIN